LHTGVHEYLPIIITASCIRSLVQTTVDGDGEYAMVKWTKVNSNVGGSVTITAMVLVLVRW